MNLFDNIVNGYKSSYLGSGQLGSDIYDRVNKPNIPQNRTLSSQDMDFVNQAVSRGATKEKAFALVTEFKYNQEQQQNKVSQLNQSRQGLFGQIGGGIMDTVGGAISEVPKVAGEVGSFLTQASQYNPISYAGGVIGDAIKAPFTDNTYGDLRNERSAMYDTTAKGFEQAGEMGKQFVQKYGAYDPTSTMAGVGEFGTDIAASLIGPNKFAPITRAGRLAKIANTAIEGGALGAKYDIATKGEITPEGVGYGAGGNLAVIGGSKVLGKGYDALKNKLPASLQLSGLLNGSKLEGVINTLKTDEHTTAPQDVGKWMLERIKPGNKQEIADQLFQHAEKTKGAVDESLAQIQQTFKNDSAKKALEQIRADKLGKVGLEGEVSQIDELLAKPELTLSELNQTKRFMDEAYQNYKLSGEEASGLKAKGMNNLRRDIKTSIESEASKYGVDIRSLNNETAVAQGLARGILKKDAVESIGQILRPLAAPGAIGLTTGYTTYSQTGDLGKAIGAGFTAGLGAKLINSTTGKTYIANFLNKLSKPQISALEKYFASGGKDAVAKQEGERIVQKMYSDLKNQKLLPSTSSYKEPSIITPQTREKAIIAESKPLSNLVKKPQYDTTRDTTIRNGLQPRGGVKLLTSGEGKTQSANVVNVKPIVMSKKLSTGISENAKDDLHGSDFGYEEVIYKPKPKSSHKPLRK